MKYQITLSEKQLQVYKDALEFYSRFLGGQVEHIPPVLQYGREYYKVREEAERGLMMFKKAVFPELRPNESYGIGWDESPIRQDAQISYELYREVYVYYQKKNPSPVSCYASATLRYSNEPLPVVKEVE